MSKDFVVGRIVKMDDVPYSKGSVGYEFVAAQRRRDAEALQQAEHRVAEAALGIADIGGESEYDEFRQALAALRKRKGQS